MTDIRQGEMGPLYGAVSDEVLPFDRDLNAAERSGTVG
jgi:hypothetical protein